MNLIVDASVAIKWGIEEAGSPAAHALLSRPGLIAPDLVIAEIANTLWKKEQRGELTAAHRPVAFAASTRSFDEFTPCGPLATRALELAAALRHPAYDCFYLALAEARGGTFVTADARLLRVLHQGGWTGKFEAL